ncbi:MAG: glycoside hydrolase family 2 [Clostridia bacterium]|nr:glycoside hydrolase family 2 [Clostridia bacterium]
MNTPWGEKIDKAAPLPEYPRPQLRRESYLNLNGSWGFYMGPQEAKPQGSLPETILVPFSPESELSGIHRQKAAGDILCYRRSFHLPKGFNRGRVLLHFGAVDHTALVLLNGREQGRHKGGYWPFTFDITDSLRERNVLEVTVADEGTERLCDARGKQSSRPGGIWYTAQSGIWQAVWLESVPEKYITGLKITPLFDQQQVLLQVNTNAPGKCSIALDGMDYAAAAGALIHLPLENLRPWSPEDPYLYEFSVSFGADTVQSYFGMRKCAVEKDEKGVPRLFLNNRPLFHNGVLDQGYWPEGLYTAPSEEAMICDIQTMKALGFNMLRKHIKIEPLRWYYLCDRMGMLVWQDMVSGGGPYRPAVVTAPAVGLLTNRVDDNYAAFGRKSELSRQRYYEELTATVELLYNSPSLVMWVAFNEGWGQFDALKAVEQIRALDGTRTIDHASGWHDQGGGDVYSRHVYFRKFRFRRDSLGRAAVLSEFGGYALGLPGHRWTEKDFGYRKFTDEGQLTAALIKLYDREIIPAIPQGLSAAVYTQLSDVEAEVNGLLTYDRRELKVEPDGVMDMNRRLWAACGSEAAVVS